MNGNIMVIGYFNNETITKIADEHDVTSAQVILRWHIQDGYIAIPGSSNAEHIAENYDLFDFELSEEEMRKIEAINEQRRYEKW
jgi:diketogulonate reductase-like aldo/keto reductase